MTTLKGSWSRVYKRTTHQPYSRAGHPMLWCGKYDSPFVILLGIAINQLNQLPSQNHRCTLFTRWDANNQSELTHTRRTTSVPNQTCSERVQASTRWCKWIVEFLQLTWLELVPVAHDATCHSRSPHEYITCNLFCDNTDVLVLTRPNYVHSMRCKFQRVYKPTILLQTRRKNNFKPKKTINQLLFIKIID